MISFTRKPRLVGSSITCLHNPESELRCESLSGVVVIFSTMKSRAVMPDCSLWVMRTVIGRYWAIAPSSIFSLSRSAVSSFSAMPYLWQKAAMAECMPRKSKSGPSISNTSLRIRWIKALVALCTGFSKICSGAPSSWI